MANMNMPIIPYMNFVPSGMSPVSSSCFSSPRICFQPALGIFFEASYWDLMPVWYHLVFLALIVPATLLGGRFGSS